MPSKADPMLRVPFEGRRHAPEKCKPLLNWSSVSQSAHGSYGKPFAPHPVLEEMLREIGCQPEMDAGGSALAKSKQIFVPSNFADYSEKMVGAKFSICRSEGDIVELGFDGGKTIRMSLQGSAVPLSIVIYPMDKESWKVSDAPGLAFAIASVCKSKTISSILSVADLGFRRTTLTIRSQEDDAKPIILVVCSDTPISFKDSEG